MKAAPALAAAVGQSHRRLVQADLWTVAGTKVGRLPISGGQITAQARDQRWTGTLTVPGTQWVPGSVTAPLAGFVPHYVRVYAGAEIDTVDQLVEVARLLVRGSRISRTAEGVVTEVTLVGLDSWVTQGAAVDYKPEIGRTVQDAIADLYRSRKPAGWTLTVFDTTPEAVTVPVAFTAHQQDPAQLLADLEAIGNLTTYADALGNLVIRPPLPHTAGTIARRMGVAVDVTGYDVEIGRDQAFANRVRVEFNPVATTSGPRTKRRFAASWDRVATADPPIGQFRWTGTNLRVGYTDKGTRRRKRQFKRVEAGDLIEVSFTNATVVLEVQSASLNDTKNYLDCEVAQIDIDGNPPATEANVEVAFFAQNDQPVIGIASKADGTLGTAAIGRVDYAESRLGNVTQAQADNRAKALLGVLLRGFAAITLTAVPDVRLEPDDDIEVTYADGQTLAHRVTAVVIPLRADEAMTLAVRTFDANAIPTHQEA